MRSAAWFFATFLLAIPASAKAQSMGTLTENGVSMDVKAAVVVYNEAEYKLTFYLLPFLPSAEEISALQHDDKSWLSQKPSPDPKKWNERCPHGRFRLQWLGGQALGNPKESQVWLYACGIGKAGSNINLNKSGKDSMRPCSGQSRQDRRSR